MKDLALQAFGREVQASQEPPLHPGAVQPDNRHPCAWALTAADA